MKKALYIGLFCVGLFAKEVDLSAELSAWKSLSYRAATKDSNGTLSATLELNKASYVGLINTPKIQYVSRPTNEGGSVSYGGMFQVEIKQKGIYRVSLGNAGNICSTPKRTSRLWNTQNRRLRPRGRSLYFAT